MKTTLASYRPFPQNAVPPPQDYQLLKQTLERIAHGAPDPVAEARRALNIE